MSKQMKLLMESFKKFLNESEEIQLPGKETYYMKEAERELYPYDFNDVELFRNLHSHILEMSRIFDEDKTDLNARYSDIGGFTQPAPHMNDAYEEKFIEYVNMADTIKKIPLSKLTYISKFQLLDLLIKNIEESVKLDAEVSPYSPRGSSILGIKFSTPDEADSDMLDPEENPYMNPNHASSLKLKNKSVFGDVDSKGEKYIMQINEIIAEVEEEKNRIIREKFVARLTSIRDLSSRFLKSYGGEKTISELIDDHGKLGFFLSETLEERWRSIFAPERVKTRSALNEADPEILNRMKEEWEEDSWYRDHYDSYQDFVFDRYGDLVQKMMNVRTAMSTIEAAVMAGDTEKIDIDKYIESLKEATATT